jgi:hypothetical protein
MAIGLSFPNVEALGTGVWKAKLDPEDLHLLGGGATRRGPLSVVLLSSRASFDCATNTLSISSAFARVLNLGSTDDAVIVESRAPSEDDMQNSLIASAAESPRQSAQPNSPLKIRLNAEGSGEKPPAAPPLGMEISRGGRKAERFSAHALNLRW